MNPVLVAARQRRKANQEKLDRLLKGIEARRVPKMTADDKTEFDELYEEIQSDIRTIERLGEEEQRMNRAAAAAAETETGLRGVYITSEPMTYGPGDIVSSAQPSYFKDLATLAASTTGQVFGDAQGAHARLQQHGKEVAIEARSNRALAQRLTEMRMTPASLETRVNPNTSIGTGGELVPPLWLVAQYVPFARAGRVCANRCTLLPLPPGTDSLNIPKITTGSLTGIQGANAVPVVSRDMVTATVSANVNTIAGQEDISMQLMEQSPINMDQVIFDDLSADYDMQLDRQVLYGSGLNGQHLGVLAQTTASANSTTVFNTDITKANAVTCASILFWDGTTATSFTQYRSVINAATNIEQLRYAPATAIWAHPRRANSWALASDSTTGRPLYTSVNVMNGLGRDAAGNVEQGVAGELYGLPVVKDANIPITCVTGALTGGTGDVIGVVKEDDLMLYEGVMRLRALPSVLSGTLQVRYQAFAYSAFFPHRFAPSTTVITGTTGLAAPSW